YKFQTLPKKTINPGIEKNLQEWLDRNDQLRQFIVVGDCTDICVYLLAIYLKTRSVEQQTHFNVVVPANCVDTYEIPVQASEKDVLPHPGDFLHVVSLYHLQVNGVQVVSAIE